METVDKYMCPVCGKHELQSYEECPYCHWEFDGLEICTDENIAVGGPMGKMTVAEAKRLVKGGKDVYGEPLPKE